MARPSSQTVKQQLDVVRQREQLADAKRIEAGNILNLGQVLGLSNTQAEEVMAKINLNSGAFTEQLSAGDLGKFAAAMNELQDEFVAMGVKGGIHPRTVINKSRKIDLKRCENEINTAVPARNDKHGVVVFRVNASAKSKDTHHAVSVQFLNFQSAISGGSITDKMAMAVNRGPVRFDCDCGRHRYWYRYIATVGGFAYGKPETGFPKIRNPQLTGIGCKHVLRVMLVLTKSPSFTRYMRDYIKRIRGVPVAKAQTMGRKQIEELAAAITQESWNGIKVRRHPNATPPKNLHEAFKANGKSIAGVGMTPNQLAKLKADSMTNTEKVREINRLLNNPEFNRTASNDVLNKVLDLLKGGVND